MNRSKKWFLALSMATMVAANGLAMAATADNSGQAGNGRPAAAEHGFRHKHGHGQAQDRTALLTFLKIDKETFRSEMKAGKTLAAIAQQQGISEQELKNFMIQQMSQRIEQGVKDGKLTAEQAEKMKQNMDKRATDRINGNVPMRGHRFVDNKELLSLLKVDAQTFRAEMKAGKSLAVVAKEHGVAEQTLKDFLLKQMQQHLDDAVKAGRVSADKAETMKAGMEQRVDNMMNGKGHMHHK